MECLWFLAGILAGCLLTSVCTAIRSRSGTLKIDHSDPEKDTYRLDLGDLDKLSNAKSIVLKIDHHADLSQK